MEWREDNWRKGVFDHIDLLYALLSTLNVLSTVLQQQSNQVLAVLQADLLLPVLVLITIGFEGDLMGWKIADP